MEGTIKKDGRSRVVGKGRRKIPMQKIDNKKSLMVAFSKRKKGLFKKAEELSILCGVDVAVVAFSPAGKPFVFSSNKKSPADSMIIDRYLSEHFSSPTGASASVDVDDDDDNNADDDDDDDLVELSSSEFLHPSSSSLPADSSVVIIEPFVSPSKNLSEEPIDVEEMKLELEEMWSLDRRLEEGQQFLETLICIPSSSSSSSY